MRVSEVLGLKKSDIDFDKRLIRIENKIDKIIIGY